MSKKNEIKEFLLDKDNLNFYYGIPSSFSTYSIGKHTPDELYENAIKYNFDFIFIADINDFLTSKTYDKNNISKWRLLKSNYNKARKIRTDFVPILGFQCKSAPFSNFNIINSKNIFSGTVRDLRLLTIWMLNNPNSFISISNGNKFSALLPYVSIYNKIITSFEISISDDTSNEKYYFSLLDRGWKLGAISYQKNLNSSFDNYKNFTAYIGYTLSKDYLIDAFKNMRTYFTQSRSLKLYFTINDIFMGNTCILNNSKVKFMIYVEDIINKIDRIEILSNKSVIIKSIGDINLNNIKYLYEHINLKEETWYIIKIYQSNNKISLSSPIFISYENKKEV